MGRLKRVCFCIFLFGLTSALFAQEWGREETHDEWGDVTGYGYFQQVVCTGWSLKAGGEGNWYFAILYRTDLPDILSIIIEAIDTFESLPTLAIFDEEVTVSLRERNSIKAFTGKLFSKVSTGKVLWIMCKDTQILNELRRNTNFTILVEEKNAQWYVRANIIGNLPSE